MCNSRFAIRISLILFIGILLSTLPVSAIAQTKQTQLAGTAIFPGEKFEEWLKTQNDSATGERGKIINTVNTFFIIKYESWLKEKLLDFGFLFNQTDSATFEDYAYERGLLHLMLTAWLYSNSKTLLNHYDYDPTFCEVSISKNNAKVTMKPSTVVIFRDNPKNVYDGPWTEHAFELVNQNGCWLIQSIRCDDPTHNIHPRGSDFNKLAATLIKRTEAYSAKEKAKFAELLSEPHAASLALQRLTGVAPLEYRYFSTNKCRTYEIEAKKLLNSFDWTISSEINSFAVKLPPNLIHDAGEYPTKIYWAYNNELSKNIGLDFSKFMGTEVWIEIYNLNEPLPEFLKPPGLKAMGVIIKSEGRIIGAYVHKGRHSSFACSLDRKGLKEIINKDWDEWIDSYINYDNPIEIMLSKMSPEEVISTYYDALSKKDIKLSRACFTKKELCSDLSSNMDNSYLYNETFPDVNLKNVKSIRIVYLKELKHLAKINQPGEVEYEVKIETYFTDNLMVLKKRETTERETARGGWRIRGIGTGP